MGTVEVSRLLVGAVEISGRTFAARVDGGQIVYSPRNAFGSLTGAAANRIVRTQWTTGSNSFSETSAPRSMSQSPAPMMSASIRPPPLVMRGALAQRRKTRRSVSLSGVKVTWDEPVTTLSAGRTSTVSLYVGRSLRGWALAGTAGHEAAAGCSPAGVTRAGPVAGGVALAMVVVVVVGSA